MLRATVGKSCLKHLKRCFFQVIFRFKLTRARYLKSIVQSKKHPQSVWIFIIEPRE